MIKLMQDLRYGYRQLSKTTAFTVTVLLTLALGIGADAAIFTLVHAVLLKNLQVADPGTLVRVGDKSECCITIGVSVAVLCVRFVQSQLYEISRADVRVVGGSILILVVAACIAGIIPAHRAASIDPVVALRMD